MRGAKPAVDMKIEKVSETQYTVSCPLQSVPSEPTRKRHKATFDLAICKCCSSRCKCPTIRMKHHRVFYFTHEYYLRSKRQKIIDSIPLERRKLRSNIEATVNEFVRKMPNRKLKVRGVFKASIFAFSCAMSINFGRIYRLIQVDPSSYEPIVLCLVNVVKEHIQFYRKYLCKIVEYLIFKQRLLNYTSRRQFFVFENPSF